MSCQQACASTFPCVGGWGVCAGAAGEELRVL